MALKVTLARGLKQAVGSGQCGMGLTRSMATEATLELPELPYSYR